MRALAGGKPIGPGRLDQDSTDMAIARFGDGALASPIPAGGFRGDQAQIGHQGARRVKAGNIAQFGDNRHRRDQGDAPQGHQAFNHRGQRPALHRLSHLFFQRGDPVLGGLDGIDIFLQDDVLRRMRQVHLSQPAKMGRRPPTFAP